VTPLLLLKSLCFLAFVVGLIYLCFYVAKKRFILNAASKNQRIKVLEQRHIHQKLAICLIEIDQNEFILIQGQNSIAIEKLPSPFLSLKAGAKKNPGYSRE